MAFPDEIPGQCGWWALTKEMQGEVGPWPLDRAAAHTLHERHLLRHVFERILYQIFSVNKQTLP